MFYTFVQGFPFFPGQGYPVFDIWFEHIPLLPYYWRVFTHLLEILDFMEYQAELKMLSSLD
jgi:hypothetical protein